MQHFRIGSFVVAACRKKLLKMGKELHGSLAAADFAGLIAVALRSELGPTHQAIKTAMNWTGASERTVKHWFAGTHGPSGEHLVGLVCHSNMVLQTFLLMAERGPNILGPQLMELRIQLLETVRQIDRHLN